VLLEYALTAKEYRGHHVMSWALTNILRMEQARGRRWAVTFIPSDNEASLRGHVKLGFEPFIVRRERRFLFTRTLTFTPTG
jgi:L-amino acid N-acyltransferase YncA